MDLQVLPVICCLVDGIVREKLIGFDELGKTHDFSTETLETRLIKVCAGRCDTALHKLRAAESAHRYTLECLVLD